MISSYNSDSLSLRSRSTCVCAGKAELSTYARAGASGSIGSTATRSSPFTIGSRSTSARGRSGSTSWMSCWKTSWRRRKTMAMTTSGTATVTLPTDTQILITREFAAPRHMVYKAWTTPELVQRWWHANRGEMAACEIDLRVGGMWRYVMVTPDGLEGAVHGEDREI